MAVMLFYNNISNIDLDKNFAHWHKRLKPMNSFSHFYKGNISGVYSNKKFNGIREKEPVIEKGAKRTVQTSKFIISALRP